MDKLKWWFHIMGGLYTLWTPWNPGGHLSIVWLIVALEIVRGILNNFYMILQGEAAPFYLGFILIYLIIITGILALNKAENEAWVGRAS